MTHIFGFERSQLLLLPEAIDDYVVADNPVRFIGAFVDGLLQLYPFAEDRLEGIDWRHPQRTWRPETAG